MYAREVNGALYTFGVSGKLIRNAMVMYDHQTRSLWSHFLGQAVKGDLVGTELDFVPVMHTTWAAWRELHPDTLVLDKNGRSSRDSYTSYYQNGSAGAPDVCASRGPFSLPVRTSDWLMVKSCREASEVQLLFHALCAFDLLGRSSAFVLGVYDRA